MKLLPPAALARLAVGSPLAPWLAGPPVVLDGQALDPHVAWLLRLERRLGAPHLTGLAVPEARANYRRMADLLVAPPPPCDRAPLTVRGGAGPLRARRYAPPARRAGERQAPRPLVVWLHGGGWTIGDLETHDAPCAALAVAADVVVVAVEYRLGPEHPFPAAVDDAWAATCDLAARAAELGADPARVAVAGDSAGGNLSAVVAQRARDAGGPRLALQVLLYPGVDCSQDAPSFETFAEGFLLTRDDVHWYRRQYLHGPDDPRDPRASPLLAPDVRGVAPAIIAVAGFDPLRDEGRAYAARLRAAGVPVERRDAVELVHGFIHLTGAVPAAARAVAEIARSIRVRMA